VRDVMLAGPSRVLATIRRGWEHRIDEVLPGVHVPAVVVRGSRDPLVSRAWVRQAAAILPNGRALEVRGGPRLLGHGAPAALASIIEGQILLRERHDPTGSNVVTIFPGQRRFTDTLIEGDTATLRSGTCQPAPFSGFPFDLA